MLPPHSQRNTPQRVRCSLPRGPARARLAGADALEQRLQVLGVRLHAADGVRVGAERERHELLHVEVDEGVLLAGRLRDGVVVAVELDRTVRAHVHEHVDLLLGQALQLLPGDGERARWVDEDLAEAGAAVGRLLRVVAGLHDTRRLEQVLGQHEVLAVAEDFVGKDLAVVTGRVGGDLDAGQPSPDESGDLPVPAPEDLEAVPVLDRASDAVVVTAADLHERLVRLLAVLGDLEHVARLLVDGVAGRAEIGLDRMTRVDRHAGVARRDGEGRLERHEVGVVAETGAAGLVGVDRVLDVEPFEEPLRGGLDPGVLGRNEAAPEELYPSADGVNVRRGVGYASYLIKSMELVKLMEVSVLLQFLLSATYQDLRGRSATPGPRAGGSHRSLGVMFADVGDQRVRPRRGSLVSPWPGVRNAQSSSRGGTDPPGAAGCATSALFDRSAPLRPGPLGLSGPRDISWTTDRTVGRRSPVFPPPARPASRLTRPGRDPGRRAARRGGTRRGKRATVGFLLGGTSAAMARGPSGSPRSRQQRRSRALRVLRRRTPGVRHHPAGYAAPLDQLPRHRGVLRLRLEHRGRLLVLPRRPPATAHPLPLQQRARGLRRPLRLPARRRRRRLLVAVVAADEEPARHLRVPARDVLHVDRLVAERHPRRDALLRPPRREPRGLAAPGDERAQATGASSRSSPRSSSASGTRWTT